MHFYINPFPEYNIIGGGYPLTLVVHRAEMRGQGVRLEKKVEKHYQGIIKSYNTIKY